MDDELARLIDRLQIEEVLNRYCRGVDRCDEATLASCYHPDGVDDHGTFVGNGREFAAWAVRGASQVWAASHHTVHNVIVDWDGADAAKVESYVLAFNQRVDPGGGDGEVEVFAGRYLDRFERRDGRWAIARRLAVRDVDTLAARRRWAGKINAGGRLPDDPLYRL
ncbi:MAG: nuclear transport factor 2 family protein [Acidimicrobiales bacterium]